MFGFSLSLSQTLITRQRKEIDVHAREKTEAEEKNNNDFLFFLRRV